MYNKVLRHEEMLLLPQVLTSTATSTKTFVGRGEIRAKLEDHAEWQFEKGESTKGGVVGRKMRVIVWR